MPVLTNFLSGVLNSQTEKLPGDLQNVQYLFVAAVKFLEEFLHQQLKSDFLVDSQDLANAFRNTQNREDAAKIPGLGSNF
jgi:hypothetical protein